MTLKIDLLSDLHGFYPELPGGDLLIVAGDLTARDTHAEYLKFYSWLHKQKYKHYIFIAGNHDNLIQKGEVLTTSLADTTYLCDSGTQFEGLKLWASPWTKTFPGMNPKCKAFTVDTEEELAGKLSLIPEDTDILITHSPLYGILDEVDFSEGYSIAVHVGSTSLRTRVGELRLKLHVFGHVHEGYGTYRSNLEFIDRPGWPIYVNASHVNERYEPVNKPIRIEL